MTLMMQGEFASSSAFPTMSNFKDSFKENVIDRFIRAYENGTTPNPCIDCNRFIKFEKLIRRAEELDFD